MLGDTSVPDVYLLLQQDPLHIDLSPYPTALTARENVDCLTSHLLQFGGVESLNLTGMTAGADVLDHIISAAEVGGVAHLTHLTLRATQLSPLQLCRLMRALSARAPRLIDLDVSENQLGDTAVDSLSAWLSPTLQSLRIAGNSLSAEAVSKLLVALAAAKPRDLATLELSDNHCDAKTCAALKTLMTTTECQTTLRELYVAHCGLDEANSCCLAEGVHGSALEVLDVSRNCCLLSFIFAVTAGQSVAFPASLRVLDLSGNTCKRGAVGGLVEALRGCSERLEELYLHHTIQGDTALSAFLCGVGAMAALRVLDLSECGLTYRSGKVLAQHLPMHTQLTVICLSHNLLEVEGVMDMASGLERLCRLSTLELGSCHLGNCGAVAVVTSLLRSCAPLERLDMSDNAINDAGLRDVCTLLSRLTCPRLRRLVISKNACTKNSQPHLLEMMQGRQSACLVVAHDTPLDEVASSSPSSATGSASNSVVEWYEGSSGSGWRADATAPPTSSSSM
ncbi:Leucine Rich repeat/Leucine rich repeat [Novymonas esmeraldas]|uniref:Leucine Rich repeat/Leucine rich repeat n=1 Tax=Novymonas esmeraldas TaxID=1808958 RepID=A0AAW0ERE7_9TRYP